MKPGSWRPLRLLGTWVALGVLLWWLWQQDWRTLWAAMAHLSPLTVAAAGGLYWLGLALNAGRWYAVLRGMRVAIPWPKTLQLTLAGAFASNFLPSTIGGDALRVTGLVSKRVPAATALTSVVIDRLLNVVVMYGFLPATWWTYKGALPIPRPVSLAFPLSGWRLVGRLPDRWRAKMAEVRHGVMVLLRSPRHLLWGLVFSWLSLVFPFTATWLLARGLGISVAWYEVAGTTVLTYTITLLPIALNGYGVREVAVTALYTSLGATSGQALTLALLTRFLMAAATLTGAFWVGEAMPE